MPKNIKNIDVSKLIPYVNNARIHSKEQVDQIAASIKEFGFNNPILTDGDNGIVAGHGRVAAAKKLGLKKVPIIELDHLTPVQKKAYILADNRIQENSTWDEDLVKVELESLIEEGADVNVQDSEGWTALLYASSYGYTEIAQLLIEAGADVNTRNNKGWTALRYASGQENPKIAKLLIDAGANVDVQDQNGWTALMLATDKGRARIAGLLIDAGANVDIQDQNGWTALMLASDKGREEISRLLIDAGADVNAQTNDGKTALVYALENGHLEVTYLLIEAGAKAF